MGMDCSNRSMKMVGAYVQNIRGKFGADAIKASPGDGFYLPKDALHQPKADSGAIEQAR